MECKHNLMERELAVTADGHCPLCLLKRIGELEKKLELHDRTKYEMVHKEYLKKMEEMVMKNNPKQYLKQINELSDRVKELQKELKTESQKSIQLDSYNEMDDSFTLTCSVLHKEPPYREIEIDVGPAMNVEQVREFRSSLFFPKTKKAEANTIIDEIKRRFGVEVIDVGERPYYYKEVAMEKEDFINRSYIIGKDTIVLGVYDNDERRIASLFHEVGHTLINGEYKDKFDYEEEAWKKAVELAMEYNIVFSPETMLWIDNQVSTYKRENKIDTSS